MSRSSSFSFELRFEFGELSFYFFFACRFFFILFLLFCFVIKFLLLSILIFPKSTSRSKLGYPFFKFLIFFICARLGAIFAASVRLFFFAFLPPFVPVVTPFLIIRVIVISIRGLNDGLFPLFASFLLGGGGSSPPSPPDGPEPPEGLFLSSWLKTFCPGELSAVVL